MRDFFCFYLFIYFFFIFIFFSRSFPNGGSSKTGPRFNVPSERRGATIKVKHKIHTRTDCGSNPGLWRGRRALYRMSYHGPRITPF